MSQSTIAAITSVSPPVGGGRLRIARASGWVAVSLGAAVGVGYLAARIEPFFAPLGLFPLLVGGILGAVLCLAAFHLHHAHRSSLFAGTVLAAIVLVVSQHYASYLTAAQQTADRARHAQVATGAFPELAGRLAGEAPPFAEFLRRSAKQGTTLFGRAWGPAGVWTLWSVNAVLVAASAVAVVSIFTKRPHCDRCGTWYATVRAGTLSPAGHRAIFAVLELPAGAQGEAKRARAQDLPAQHPPAQDWLAQYRLSQCRSGCGPVRCQLLWKSPGVVRVEAWLAREDQTRISAILDGVLPVVNGAIDVQSAGGVPAAEFQDG